MNYLFFVLGALFALIIFLRIRRSLVLLLKRNKLAGKKFILFYVLDKYSRGKRPEVFYHLMLAGEEKKYKVSVPVSKAEYDRMEKGSEYGLLPVYYDEHNEKVYIIGEKKEMSLNEALSQDINYVIFSLIIVICTILGLYYAYHFIM